MRRSRLSSGYINPLRLKRELRRGRNADRLNAVLSEPEIESPQAKLPDPLYPPNKEEARATQTQKRRSPKKTPKDQAKPHKEAPHATQDEMPSGQMMPNLMDEIEAVREHVHELENALFREREKLRALESLVNVMSGNFEIKQPTRLTLVKVSDIIDADFQEVTD